MAKSQPLALTPDDRNRLEAITRTRTIQAQVATRARILLLKADGESTDSIAEKVDLNCNSVLLCLRKYKEGGIENAIYDAPGRGRNAEITDEEKSWIINVACQKPADVDIPRKHGPTPNLQNISISRLKVQAIPAFQH